MKETSWVHHSISDVAGGIARGVALVIVGHPLDTIKVRLQTQSSYKGFIEVASVLQKEGLMSFYRGSGPPLLSSGFFSAYYLWLYGSVKRLVIDDHTKSPTIKQMMIVGIMCGIGSSWINSPVELVKCKLQSNRSGYSNTFDCTRSILRAHGIPGLAQGYVATLSRNTIGDMGYYGVYELSKYRLVKQIGHFWGVLLAGGLGGMAFWTTIYPLDVIKSKLQSQSYDIATRTYKGTFDCIKKTYLSEGLSGFWRGYWVCLFRSFPTNAAGFSAYEYVRKCVLENF